MNMTQNQSVVKIKLEKKYFKNTLQIKFSCRKLKSLIRIDIQYVKIPTFDKVQLFSLKASMLKL